MQGILLIAQVPPPSGVQLLVWLGCAAAVLGAVSFGLALFNQAAKARLTLSGKRDGMDISPNPLIVQPAKEFALRNDCATRHALLDAQIKAAMESDRLERQRIYDQIDIVERRGEDKLGQAMTQMHELIRKLPQEVVDLLHKTGQLRQ